MNFTTQQQEIIYTNKKRCFILASAGSGKSSVLCGRVEYLINDLNVNSDSIFVFSFSTTAAGELKNRLQKSLSPNDYNNVHISTIHSFCYHVFTKLGNKVNILSEGELQQSIMTMLSHINPNMEKKELRQEADNIMDVISKDKRNARSPYFPDSKYQQLYNNLETWKKSRDLWTFDDLIYETILLFRKNEKLLKQYQDKYQYIFLDESQDNNLSQFTILDLLLTESSNIMVLSDIQQTLFGFQYADWRELVKFCEKNSLEVIQLNETFRFGLPVQNVANYIVSQINIPDNYKIQTVTNQTHTKNVNYFESCDSVVLIEEIHKRLNEGYQYKDINVLARTNRELDSISNDLLIENIPFSKKNKIFLDKRVCKYLLNIISLLQRFSYINFAEYIKVTKIEIGKKILDHMKDVYLEDNNKENVIQFLNKIINSQVKLVGMKRIQYLIETRNLFEGVQEIISLQSDNTFEKIAKFIEIDALPFMSQQVKESDGESQNQSNWKLINFCDRMVQEYKLQDDIYRFEDFMRLKFGSDDEKESRNTVKLRTIHSSKGMTLPIVFLLLNNFCNKHYMYTDEDYLNELFVLYVGCTRAKYELNIMLSNPECHRMGWLFENKSNPIDFQMDSIPKRLSIDEEISKIPGLEHNFNKGCSYKIGDSYQFLDYQKKPAFIKFSYSGKVLQEWFPFSQIGINKGKVFFSKWIISQKIKKI